MLLMVPHIDEPESGAISEAVELGLRYGERGTHTSRTMMLGELDALLHTVSSGSSRPAYTEAIADDNALGKRTVSSRQLTGQRLRELYALDPEVPLFRALRRAWDIDPEGRPLLALLAAAARDPLLRSTAGSVLDLPRGADFDRQRMAEAIRAAVGDRLGASTLDKVVRNAGSSWTQSGHLRGRVKKVRITPRATPATAAFAAWLGYAEGARGEGLLNTRWTRMLDRSRSEILDLMLRARRLDLLDARVGGNITDIDPRRLDPGRETRA